MIEFEIFVCGFLTAVGFAMILNSIFASNK